MLKTRFHASRSLNRDFIKCFAMFTMALNHLHDAGLVPDGALGTFFTDLGYFTFIAMTYFLVEGYEYTHDLTAYRSRLFIFAVISQLPFSLALSHGETGTLLAEGNVLFNLCICFEVIGLLGLLHRGENVTSRLLLCFLLSLCCDWSFLGPLFTTLFYEARRGPLEQGSTVSEGGAAYNQPASSSGSPRSVHSAAASFGPFALETSPRRRERTAFLLALVCFVLFNFTYNLSKNPVCSVRNLLLAADPEALIGPFLAFLVIHYGYNGRRARFGHRFFKWFFYIFYPAHLTVIALIRFMMR